MANDFQLQLESNQGPFGYESSASNALPGVNVIKLRVSVFPFSVKRKYGRMNVRKIKYENTVKKDKHTEKKDRNTEKVSVIRK